MKSLSVALLQNDPRTARLLAGSLCHHFQAIHVAHSINELRDIIIRFRTEVVVMDMERASMGDVQLLHRDFGDICIVCTHRLADEEMWAAALNAGASDICSSVDTHGILTAALRNAGGLFVHSAAA